VGAGTPFSIGVPGSSAPTATPQVDMVARVKCALSPLLPPRIMSRQTVHAHLSLSRQQRGDLVVPNASQCPPVQGAAA
jgi:hypothetical protein